MESSKGVIYINPKGWQNREYSHSQSSRYRECPTAYKFRYLQGWKDRLERATSVLGIDFQEAIRRHYIEKLDPVEQFCLLWEVRREQELRYSPTVSWEKLNEQGAGLLRRFLELRETFPVSKPVFFDYKDRPKIKDAHVDCDFTAITDFVASDAGGLYLCDIKLQYQGEDETTPGLVINKLQLRTQAAVIGIYRVVLWVFVRSLPARVEIPDAEIVSEAAGSPEVLLYLAKEFSGANLTEIGTRFGIADPKAKSRELIAAAKKDAELTARLEAAAAALGAKHKPQYKIQWLAGEMTKEHALEALRDELSDVQLIQQGWFPRRGDFGGFNSKCDRCAYRGLCLTELWPNAPEEYRRRWDEITREELVRYDEEATGALDE